ncbi:GNAT family N-acetyltransferase [Chryseobacterium kwangjuense]|uniref:GNAT family acetyltransferase n=1 Tax=Chryseobacterium kwangjuense TaxID=267125 RepID=A0A135WHY0_9FLAO|nr:GNAT family N-acetyltransferase [Chryseobacterium kwangjuense]KXH84528.1 GNAT family acetyltransferase [Chryseobacterium kwangjuense]
MKEAATHEIVGKWLKAWSLSRQVSLPVEYKSGFKVDVGDEKQKTRYVFSELNDDFLELSQEIDEPWVYLKVCISHDQVQNVVPRKWDIQPPGYMMKCSGPMQSPARKLADGYHLEYEKYNTTNLIKIIAQNGDLASSGYIVLMDDLAVYDRIITDEKHQRKGLGSFLMLELEKIALAQGISNHFLVATEEGKALYESLGWELYSHYTSIVISK